MTEGQKVHNPGGAADGAENGTTARLAAMARFYLVRFRLYIALALLVALVWIPTLAVPTLRHRLASRVERLRAAVAGTRNTLPVTSGVGENPKPFPLEFERPVAERPRLAIFPARPSLVDMTQQPIAPAAPAPERPARPSQRAAATQPEPPAPPPEQAAAPPAAPSDEPQYLQEKEEQEAYNLLLETNSDVKAIVDGGNPSLRLKTWGAAKRAEDTFWVKLTLTTAQGSDADFIWQVRVAANQVTALNFNARSLAR